MSAGVDTMALAVDWLDAYRSAQLDALLNLYNDEASLECGCGGQKILLGKAALKQYWIQRFAEKSALELEDLQPEGDNVALAFYTSEGLVRAVLSFNDLGKITRSRCGPPAEIQAFSPPPR
jgi:ketosteroid isomerase-like protein